MVEMQVTIPTSIMMMVEITVVTTLLHQMAGMMVETTPTSMMIMVETMPIMIIMAVMTMVEITIRTETIKVPV